MDNLDRKIEKIIKQFNQYSEGDSDYTYFYALCDTFKGTEFNKYWNEYWLNINDKRRSMMTDYFNKRFVTSFEKGFLRLLVLEDFKNYLRKQGIK